MSEDSLSLGEDGVVRESHSMEAIISCLPREVGFRKTPVLHSCVDASDSYLAVGSEQGYVWIADLQNSKILREFSDCKGCVITTIKLNDLRDCVAYGTDNGSVRVETIAKHTVNKWRIQERSSQPVSCVEWTDRGDGFYCGFTSGRIINFQLSFEEGTMEHVALPENYGSRIIQLSSCGRTLLVSSLERAMLLDTQTFTLKQVGRKERKTGPFGGCFMSDGRLCLSRPGLRFWIADNTGTVLITRTFKEALSTQHLPLVPTHTIASSSSPQFSKSWQFTQIFPWLARFVVTYHEHTMFVLDSEEGLLVGVVTFNHMITDLAVAGQHIYILSKDSTRSIARVTMHPSFAQIEDHPTIAEKEEEEEEEGKGSSSAPGSPVKGTLESKRVDDIPPTVSTVETPSLPITTVTVMSDAKTGQLNDISSRPTTLEPREPVHSNKDGGSDNRTSDHLAPPAPSTDKLSSGATTPQYTTFPVPRVDLKEVKELLKPSLGKLTNLLTIGRRNQHQDAKDSSNQGSGLSTPANDVTEHESLTIKEDAPTTAHHHKPDLKGMIMKGILSELRPKDPPAAAVVTPVPPPSPSPAPPRIEVDPEERARRVRMAQAFDQDSDLVVSEKGKGRKKKRKKKKLSSATSSASASMERLTDITGDHDDGDTAQTTPLTTPTTQILAPTALHEEHISEVELLRAPTVLEQPVKQDPPAIQDELSKAEPAKQDEPVAQDEIVTSETPVEPITQDEAVYQGELDKQEEQALFTDEEQEESTGQDKQVPVIQEEEEEEEECEPVNQAGQKATQQDQQEEWEPVKPKPQEQPGAATEDKQLCTRGKTLQAASWVTSHPLDGSDEHSDYLRMGLQGYDNEATFDLEGDDYGTTGISKSSAPLPLFEDLVEDSTPPTESTVELSDNPLYHDDVSESSLAKSSTPEYTPPIIRKKKAEIHPTASRLRHSYHHEPVAVASSLPVSLSQQQKTQTLKPHSQRESTFQTSPPFIRRRCNPSPQLAEGEEGEEGGGAARRVAWRRGIVSPTGLDGLVDYETREQSVEASDSSRESEEADTPVSMDDSQIAPDYYKLCGALVKNSSEQTEESKLFNRMSQASLHRGATIAMGTEAEPGEAPSGADIWVPILHPSRYQLQCVCLSDQLLWVVDTKGAVFCTTMESKGRDWQGIKKSMSQISSSSSGKIVWGVYNHSAYVRLGIGMNPAGSTWKNTTKNTPLAHKVKMVAVDENGVWAVTNDGQILFRKDVEESNPEGKVWVEVGFGSGFSFVVCCNNVVWALTNGGKVFCRDGITPSSPSGRRWMEMKSPKFSAASITANGVVWGINDDNSIGFKCGAVQGKPSGKGPWWEVKIGALTHPSSPYNSLWQVMSTEGNHILTSVSSLVSSSAMPTHSKLLSISASSKAGVVVLESGSKIHACWRSATGYHYKPAYRDNMVPMCDWMKVAAGHTGLWVVNKRGELFCLPAGEKLTHVECPSDVELIAASPTCMWVVSKELVWSRQGMTAEYPQGISFDYIELSTLLHERKLRSVSCGKRAVWAVDTEGCPYFRFGVHAREPGTGMSPAWIPLDDNREPLIHVTVSPDNWLVWACDEKFNVYARTGVTQDFPVGRKWEHVPSEPVKELCATNEKIYALTSEGELLCRYGINEGNMQGNYWRRMPGKYVHITTGVFGELWTLDARGQVWKQEWKVLAVSHKPNAGQKDFEMSMVVDQSWEVV